jgi:anti-sigma-K factor RskA
VSTPEDLLAEAPLEAAVAALAERNHHHLAEMTPAERDDAIAHWRQIAVAVLTAAGAALQEEPSLNGDEGPGRAVIVLEDSGPEEIAIHASFFPQLEDLGGGQVGATPAQAAALELLEQISDDDDPLAD